MAKSLIFLFLIVLVFNYILGSELDGDNDSENVQSTTEETTSNTDTNMRQDINEMCSETHNPDLYHNYIKATKNMMRCAEEYMSFEDPEFKSSKADDIWRIVTKYCSTFHNFDQCTKMAVDATMACLSRPKTLFGFRTGFEMFHAVEDYACHRCKKQTVDYIHNNGIQCFLMRMTPVYNCLLKIISKNNPTYKIPVDFRRHFNTCMEQYNTPCRDRPTRS